MPVSWSILATLDAANSFTIHDALDQADRVAPEFPAPVALTPAVKRLTG